MKATAEILGPKIAVEQSAGLRSGASSIPGLSPAISAGKSWLAIYADLFKARLTFLVLLTTLIGFYMGVRGSVDYLLMLHTILGTALLAGGSSSLNQLFEREHDAKMRRTRGRPLPSGCLQPQTVVVIGSACVGLGLMYLAFAVNFMTCLVGAFTFVSYLFVYTPLKRVTWLNTAVGAIPGALPPVMGWTAARGEMGGAGLALFAIQAFWQLPHFMAIAWIYRDEYAKAGFKMLSVVDLEGARTGRQAFTFSVGLLLVSLCPFVFGLAGRIYLADALVLGLTFIWFAFRFWCRLTERRARQLFYFSLLYLPLLLTVMVFDKVK